MQRYVELKLVGSDPELSFCVTGPDGKVILLPAPEVVGNDKAVGLRSFIGNDGHASTAEIRPAPCRNVYWHMIKIGDALKEIEVTLHSKSAQRERPVIAVAQPSLGPTETMGGHIWISLYANDPGAYRLINQGGLIYDLDLGDMQQSRMYPPMEGRKKNISSGELQTYYDLSRTGKMLCLDTCWKKLHYLIQPLELMLYGSARKDRANTNNVRDPYYRTVDKPTSQDQASMRSDKGYFRFEYRYPSSWLQHPTIAYAYLALAKLAVLNWELLPGPLDITKVIAIASNTYQLTARTSWMEVLKARVGDVLSHKNVTLSRDLRDIETALTALYTAKLRFPAMVNFEAWADLKPKGQ